MFNLPPQVHTLDVETVHGWVRLELTEAQTRRLTWQLATLGSLRDPLAELFLNVDEAQVVMEALADWLQVGENRISASAPHAIAVVKQLRQESNEAIVALTDIPDDPSALSGA